MSELFSLKIKGVKVKLYQRLTKHHAMKTYWKNRDVVPRIFSPGTRWEWSALRPGRFTSGERASGTHWRPGVSRSLSGRCGEEDKLTVAAPRNRTLLVHPLAHSL